MSRIKSGQATTTELHPLLVTLMILACVPWIVLGLSDRIKIPYVNVSIAMSLLWLLIAIVYVVLQRSKKALWIFILAPVALGPAIFVFLLYLGVLYGFGRND